MFANKSREVEKQFLKRLRSLPGLIKIAEELSNRVDSGVDDEVVKNLKREYVDLLEIFGHLDGEDARILKEKYLDKTPINKVFEKQYLSESAMYFRLYKALDSLKAQIDKKVNN